MPALNDLLDQFTREHPEIQVKAQYVPTGDALIQKLIAAIQSHTAPDVCWVHSDFLDKLAEPGAIYNLGEFIRGPDGLAENDLADIFPPLLQAATWRDSLFALPFEATTLALLYNRRLFREAGLDPSHPPADWEELYEYATRLTMDRDGDGKIDQFGFYVPVFPASGDLNIWMILQWTPFLWQAGGEEIDHSQTRVLFNSEAGVQALSFWKKLYEELGSSTFSLAHDMAFASGRLAMVLDGPWNLPRYRQARGLDWAVAPLPAGPAKRATYLAGEHLVILKQSRHPQQAWTFIKWILRPEVQCSFSIKSGYLPVRRSTLELARYREFLAADSAMQAFVQQIDFAQGRRPVDYHRVEINRCLAEAIEKAVVGKVDPKKALDEAAGKANRLLERVKRGQQR